MFKNPLTSFLLKKKSVKTSATTAKALTNNNEIYPETRTMLVQCICTQTIA